MEILVLVFVFSYTNSGAEFTPEEKTSTNQEVPDTQFLLGDINIPASSKDDLSVLNLDLAYEAVCFRPALLKSVSFPRLASLSPGLNGYYTYTTINAP